LLNPPRLVSISFVSLCGWDGNQSPVDWIEERNPTKNTLKPCNTRRANIPGACYFFTVNLAERNKTLLIDHVDELRTAFAKIKQNYPFTINAMVVLPDHLHTL
jgi:hypothetical protein